MGQIESLIFLLGVAALLAQLARVVNVPYPIFLVPLLNSASFFSSPLDLRAHIRAITLLAVGLVFATTFSVAAVAHYAIGLPWAVSFVLGAILAPTDPVAAEAIFR